MGKESGAMGVLIQNLQHTQKIDLREIRKKAQKILDILGVPEKELSILLTDDPKIAELNQKYLRRARPTNVIAFPMQEGPHSEINPQIAGDVVISVETAQREATAAGLSLNSVLEMLLVHGILHLFGYDHERSDRQARRMEGKEEEILGALAVEFTADKLGKSPKEVH